MDIERTDEEIDELANQAARIMDGEEDGNSDVGLAIADLFMWLRGANTRPL